MKVDVILNGNARHLRPGRPLREVVVGAASRGGASVHETRTLEDLDRVAKELAARGTDAVVLAGGDGSHMRGLSALRRAWGDELPPVALAPGGTVGTIARNLGMRGGARAAERIIAAACDGDARIGKHPSLRVTDDAGGDSVAFIFGAGLVARFFEEYDGAGAQGVGPAAAIATKIFAGSFVGSTLARRVLAPATCSLEINGEIRSARAWSLVLASVVRDVGLHVLATYRAGEECERFHVVASGLSPRGLAMQVPRVLSGRPMRGTHHVDTLARSLRLRFEQPGAYVIDGDALRAREVRVDAGPELRLILP